MNAVVVLEWAFSPSGYLEGELIEVPNLYTMTISGDRITAHIDSTIFDINPHMRTELHDNLVAKFLGMQLLTDTIYELSESTIKCVYPDGHILYKLSVQNMEMKSSLGTIAVQTINQDGSVIFDSRKDQNEINKNYLNLIVQHSADSLLIKMLQSYRKAMHDSSNELVHLFEIREALVVKFENENNVRNTLNISKPQISEFRKLCNNSNLKQGRHRGQNIGTLREASLEELQKARGIAKTMITAYINYLEAVEADSR
ncbi:MAG: hypothetical protein K9L79_09610 [Methylobacter tundripaludum]|nr:hypothetical protein [Methylobacter tundripaludum]